MNGIHWTNGWGFNNTMFFFGERPSLTSPTVRVPAWSRRQEGRRQLHPIPTWEPVSEDRGQAVCANEARQTEKLSGFSSVSFTLSQNRASIHSGGWEHGLWHGKDACYFPCVWSLLYTGGRCRLEGPVCLAVMSGRLPSVPGHRSPSPGHLHLAPGDTVGSCCLSVLVTGAIGDKLFWSPKSSLG